MADPVPILLKRTLTPDKAPDPGDLEPGELSVELASTPIKLWIGVPTSVAASQQLLVAGGEVAASRVGVAAHATSGQPATTAQAALQELYTAPGQSTRHPDGAFLRMKKGDTFSWEDRILVDESTFFYFDPIPVLHFISSGYETKGNLFSAENHDSRPAVTFATNQAMMAKTDLWAEWYNPPAALVYAIGSAPGLWVDYYGDRSGIRIDNEGDGSRGLDINRGPTAGWGIRFSHKPIIGSVATTAEYLLGDIAFTGIHTYSGSGQGTRIVRGEGARVQAVSTQAWNAGARGARVEIWTTPNGAAAARRSLVVDHDGSLSVMRSGTLTSLDSLLAVGTPGGTNGQLQYNNNGAFGGANVTISADRNSLTVPGNINGARFGLDARGDLAIGSFTPLASNAGIDNLAIGKAVLFSTTIGMNNVGVGDWVLYENVLGSNNTAIGNGALGTADSNGNTAIGSAALNNLTTGNHNVAIGAQAGGWYNFTEESVFVGYAAAAGAENTTNEIVIGTGAVGHGSHTITLGNSNTTDLHCNAMTITALSDPRLKEDIKPADLDRCLAAVEGLPVHRYGWKEMAGAHRDKHVTGWLPDDVAKVFPKAVTFSDIQRDGVLIGDCQHITMTEALPTLWGAVQCLSQKIEELQRQIGDHRG